MRDVQMALERQNMKQTSMEDFINNLDSNACSEVLSDLHNMVISGIVEHHAEAQRKRSPFFKITKELEISQVAFIGMKILMADMVNSNPIKVASTVGDKVGAALLDHSGRQEDMYSLDEKIIKDRISAGLTLLKIVIESLPSNYFRISLDRIKTSGSKPKTQYKILAESGFKKLVEDNEDIFYNFTKKMLPMVCKPDDWSSTTGGGYITDEAKASTPLIKRIVNHEEPEGNIVFDSINHLQGTPYRINKRIFKVCKELQGIKPKDMHKVFMEDLGKFEEPCPIDRDSDAYLWEKVEGIKVDSKGKEKKAMVMVHQDDESISKRKEYFKWISDKELHESKIEAKRSIDRSYATCISLTEELEKYDEIFWSYGLDRRSRVYPSAMTGINLQGSDYQKANVEFSVGLPLDFDGDGEGGEYAIIKTMCNHWGNDSGNGVKTDKLNREQAQDWLYGRSGYKGSESWILKCAKSPLDNKEWMKADKPLQFLAAIFEWSDYKAYRVLHNDYKFVSHLCDPNDASCSGAQILSAATRDMVGAMHTNLLDMPVQDLYMAVARKVSDNLFERFEDCNMSQDWLGRNNVINEIQEVLRGNTVEVMTDGTQELILQYSEKGLTVDDIYKKVYPQMTEVERDRLSLIIRNLVKKPVMVKFYSGTRYGNIEHCNEFIVEKKWEGNFRSDSTGAAGAFMGSLIYDSINQVISGAGKVMEWFVHVADVLGGQGQDVKWTTPVGFKASLKKYAKKTIRVLVDFYGEKGKFNEFSIQVPKTKKSEEGNLERVIDVAKMKSGIAPDIVHSLDASLIMKVAERCKREGINYLTMIHDSLGSHCCFSGRFNRIIREEFIEIFKGDILQDMYLEFLGQLDEDAKCLLASPRDFGVKYGNYELSTILKSEFCFK